jgi:DNA modification methylase/transcriptional regulator with XRE-family HTH domain
MAADLAQVLTDIRARNRMSQQRLAAVLGASLASVARWEAGTAEPSPEQRASILRLLESGGSQATANPFASRGVRRSSREPTLFDDSSTLEVALAPMPLKPILERITDGHYFDTGEGVTIDSLLAAHPAAAPTVTTPPDGGMSAGKNTYTYDAHTYHTKVPPQGIAELVKHYLPSGGLVLDAFAGSGMTGVATSALGHDCVLNELSPAACFIASRFVSRVPAQSLLAAVATTLDELADLRRRLYSTTCRECSRTTELRYVVWSYRVLCPECDHEFNLWDVCRSYGRTVREHKILTEFGCPNCQTVLKKAKLSRTTAEPVQVGYMCCGSRQQEQVHPPSDDDLALIGTIEASPPLAEGFYPADPVPDGVNLGQPRRHALVSVDKFYTARNLAALSHIWRTIHRFEDAQLAGQLAFAFTSLYRRVTRFSEFRFWGGSGNTARLNVPFIFDEPNVFIAFERKARTIADHLASTATHYSGRTVIAQGSATDMRYLPDESIDLVFTDPPFGANINYSEMNLLWESWLGRRTDPTDEAIVNRFQGKDLAAYGKLMSSSLAECYRVLRPGHWMLLVFMNSSAKVWECLREAISEAGFVLVKADVFDKQHGTFKHFVSENTAGADLVLHCLKPKRHARRLTGNGNGVTLDEFLRVVDADRYLQPYLHVARPTELDLRRLYSEWVARAIVDDVDLLDFPTFREKAMEWLQCDDQT